MGFLLFVPAGTTRYWQAWAYLSIFFGAAALTTLYLIRNDPALLERRISGGPTKEKQRTQQFIMMCASLGFIALLVVPALDYRFGWSTIPFYGVLVGDALVAVGFFFIFLVYRENTFTSATIELAPDQKVISTGPYAIVRHPMYGGTLLLIAGIPLLLGSWWGLALAPVIVLLFAVRAVMEERTLMAELPGYTEYAARVRYRLVPLIW
jgi:protein-S-isoprenylcysteine O-methyltransferase Ste14